MSGWYRAGTVSINNGSSNLVGVGTAWIDAGVAIGEAVRIGGVGPLEVLSVNSNTSITLGEPYVGANAVGAGYVIVPTQSYERDLAAAIKALAGAYGAVKDLAGKGYFPPGLLEAGVLKPSLRGQVDDDTGTDMPGGNVWRAVSGGQVQLRLKHGEVPSGPAVDAMRAGLTPLVSGMHRSYLQLPAFSLGDNGVVDEYLIVARASTGGPIKASGLMGEIYTSRGGESFGNSSAVQRVNIVNAYLNNKASMLTHAGPPMFTGISVLTVNGVYYDALQARSFGGFANNGAYFVGALLNDVADPLMFTRVRASDPGVAVVLDGYYESVDDSAPLPTVGGLVPQNIYLSTSAYTFGMGQFSHKRQMGFMYPTAGWGAFADCTDFYVAGSSPGDALTQARLTSAGDLATRGQLVAGAALNDFAEYFEWADGNPAGEDRIGISVVLDSGKVRPATANDAPAAVIGAVSARAGLALGGNALEWGGQWQRDVWGRVLTDAVEYVHWTEHGAPQSDDGGHAFAGTGAGAMRTYRLTPLRAGEVLAAGVTLLPADVVVPGEAQRLPKQEPRLSPGYDPTHVYTPRSDRAEWACVGLVGQVLVRAGQPVGDRWIKLRDAAEGVEEWLIR